MTTCKSVFVVNVIAGCIVVVESGSNVCKGSSIFTVVSSVGLCWILVACTVYVCCLLSIK